DGGAGTGFAVTADPRAANPSAATRPTELVDQRTETRTVYRHPNGARTVVLSAGPIRLRRGDGWVPIDLTLRRDPDGGIRPVADPLPVSLAGGGSSDPGGTAAAVHGAGDEVIALPWTGPLPAPKLDGNRATYPGARPGADLVIEVTRSGFVASLRPAPSTS